MDLRIFCSTFPFYIICDSTFQNDSDVQGYEKWIYTGAGENVNKLIIIEEFWRSVRYSMASQFAISSKCIHSFHGPGMHCPQWSIQFQSQILLRWSNQWIVFECSTLGDRGICLIIISKYNLKKNILVYHCTSDGVSRSILPVSHFIDVLKSRDLTQRKELHSI